MALKGDTFAFSISQVGETTGEKFNWAFTAKRRLSIRDRIQKDSIRRSLVGDKPEFALPETVFRAEMLAHLSVSITDSPKAWRESGDGLDLYDDNVLLAIYDEINKGQAEVQAQVEAEAKETKEKLRKTARSKKVEEEDQKDEGTGGGAA